MKIFKIYTRKRKLLSDIITPVGIYLKIRDRFANSFLLESSDYHGEENSYSYICCRPIADFELKNQIVKMNFPDGSSEQKTELVGDSVLSRLKYFSRSFQGVDEPNTKNIQTGMFGYMAYDAIENFETIELTNREKLLPDIRYTVFRYIIAFNHFKNECSVIENYWKDKNDDEFNEIVELINQKSIPSFQFRANNHKHSNFTDDEFLRIVKRGIHHCDIGDVFQVVFSRRFIQGFQGDEFQVYRSLRSINPSPYLFYFDYGSYKLFGSSPEAQIVVDKGKAVIYPIAGTFRRSGNDKADEELAKKLLDDPKENSEHIMLVDLARNDLSRCCSSVKVESYKEIQYYSHVIHLVSKVSGTLDANRDSLDIVTSTFPAGTLTGAPKHKAMQLINEKENLSRGFYGGAIGFMDFEGNFNHAIMIRTFLSQANKLIFQAGAGVVALSNPNNEVKEVYNKIAALESAIRAASEIY